MNNNKILNTASYKAIDKAITEINSIKLDNKFFINYYQKNIYTIDKEGNYNCKACYKNRLDLIHWINIMTGAVYSALYKVVEL